MTKAKICDWCGKVYGEYNSNFTLLENNENELDLCSDCDGELWTLEDKIQRKNM